MTTRNDVACVNQSSMRPVTRRSEFVAVRDLLLQKHRHHNNDNMNRLVARLLTSNALSSVRVNGPQWTFSTSAGDLNSKFQACKENSTKLKSDPGNEVKLQLYSLYKQATVGANKTEKPGAFDIVGKYKWAAWSNLGDMSQEQAKKEYIKLIEKLEQELGTNK